MSLRDKLKNLLFPASPEPGAPPAWAGRLKQAEYQSPSGKVIPFEYADISVTVGTNTAAFGNISTDGQYIQDNGIAGLRLPMAMIFHGTDNDIQAQAMLQALTEKGEGTLFHPVFGAVQVVRTGDIEYNTPLATGANNTTIIVEFYETTGLQIGGLPAFGSLLDSLNAASAESFARSLDVSSVADKKNFIQKVQRSVAVYSNTLKAVSGLVSAQQARMDDIGDSINRTIDTIVGQPLVLARQMQILIGEPARIAGGARDKLSGYGNMARSIFGQSARDTRYDRTGQNDFYIDRLSASSAVSGMSESALNNDFDKAEQFIEAAELLISFLDGYTEWRDTSYVTTGTDDDTGDGLQELQQLVGVAVNQLLSDAGNADITIRSKVGTMRGTLELCFELAGSAKPDVFSAFCNFNNFSGDQIFMIEPGSEIVWRV